MPLTLISTPIYTYLHLSTLQSGARSASASPKSREILRNHGEQGTFGYSTFNTIKNTELFDPSTLTWTSTGNMVFSSEGQTMTLLSNGQVLSAGGESFDKGLNRLVSITDAQIYTP